MADVHDDSSAMYRTFLANGNYRRFSTGKSFCFLFVSAQI
jgi:hypothetical protein